MAIGIIEFVEIWGGCCDMDYGGAWFSWCDAQVLRAAWRKCGWLGCVIAPEEIDRTGFVDRGPSTAAPLLQERAPPTPLPSIAEALEAAMAVPDSMRAGTLAAAQLQVKQLTEALKVRDAAPFDAVAAGLLQPKVAGVKKRERDKTRIDESEGGDAFLRDLAGNARSKQVRREGHRLEVDQRKQARLDAAAAAADAAAAVRLAFDMCHPICTCGTSPCPQAKMQLCATCGVVKPHACRVRACVAARGPLLLTMRDETAALMPPPPEPMALMPPPPEPRVTRGRS